MNRYLVLLILGLIFAAPAWPQATETDDADAADTVAADEVAAEVDADEAAADEEAAEEVDDSDLDEQVYRDTDDDFRPSEEIPADQSIAFPTDI